MKGNHVLISRITTTKDIEYIDFTNISQQYSDLKIVVSMRSTDSAYYDYPQMYLNNDWDDGLGSYAYKRLYVSTTSVYSSSGTSMASPAIGSVGNGATANTFGSLEYYIFNYSSTTQYKNISCDAVGANNSSSVVLGINASTRQSNQAIYRIVFTAGLGSIKAGSSFSIYGIANAVTTPTSSPKAFGGDIVRTDGTYWYHAFTGSGIFKPQVNLTADILQVAGGGSGTGGDYACAGGGAGGLLTFTGQALAALTNYTCVVGAGGAVKTYNTGNGNNGSNSRFGSLTESIGGGGAGGFNGSNDGQNGNTGGSGGGGSYLNHTGGAGTTGQGFAGGSANGAAPGYPGGSGGGAGGAGNTPPNGSTPVAGGIGLTSSLTNAMGAATSTGQLSSGNYYYAGGGGGGGYISTTGGAGGLGGGGNGQGAGNGALGFSGAMGTGGGGGGSGQAGNPGAGGSGIIIIRYPV